MRIQLSTINQIINHKNITLMTKTITFNELRRIKDSLPDGSMHRIADELNVTTQTVRNYFGGSNYSFGKNCGLHIEPGPDGGIVVLDNTQIYDMAIRILEEENKKYIFIHKGYSKNRKAMNKGFLLLKVFTCEIW